MNADLLRSNVRDVLDYPQKGVLFKDIAPILQNRNLFQVAVNELMHVCPADIQKIVGVEARGFIFASALATRLGTGLVMARKKGKLPHKTIGRQYALEYGTATLEMHKDSIVKGERILLFDDVLATGGTMAAAVDLTEQLEGKIAGILFFIEIDALAGREKLKDYSVHSLIHF